MEAIALCYHDILCGKHPDASGFPGPVAASYKLDEADFRAHMRAIAAAHPSPPLSFEQSIRFTFDDGGASACRIADILEFYGWRGYFFVPTDYIGQPSFLGRSQIAELSRRGHLIGSHSCSHKGRMSSMSGEALLREWSSSAGILSEIISQAVTAASIPSGYYSRPVAEAAARAGLKLLFTLEPTGSVHVIDGCEVAGRYTMRRRTQARVAASICIGKLAPRLQQQLFWSVKKIAKTTPLYSAIKNFYFSAHDWQ